MRRRKARARPEGNSLTQLYPRGFWRLASVPGVVWILLLFVVPFFALVSMAGGGIGPTGTAVPEWNPAYWDRASLRYVIESRVSSSGVSQAVFLRTIVFVVAAVILIVLIGYPVAYHVARLHGRRRAVM